MISVPSVHMGSPASPYVSLVGATQPGDLSDLEARLMGMSLVHAPSNGSSRGSSVCSNGIQDVPVCQLCYREGHHMKDCPVVTILVDSYTCFQTRTVASHIFVHGGLGNFTVWLKERMTIAGYFGLPKKQITSWGTSSPSGPMATCQPISSSTA